MSTMITRLLPVLALAGLAACAGPKLPAPTDRGVCYTMVTIGQTHRFDPIARNKEDIYHCALELERMKMNLERLTPQQSEITGSFQGRFLFLNEYGIFQSDRYDGIRYLMLVRYNRQLVVPSAVPQ